jgi:hypothetical protein
MGTDRRSEPATLVSPGYPALKTNQPPERQPDAFTRLGFGSAAASEVTRRGSPAPELEALEEDEGAAIEINALFGRKLMALRRMPRRDRPHALRAAREWRRQALKALRDKRAAERHARHILRRLRTPSPC